MMLFQVMGSKLKKPENVNQLKSHLQLTSIKNQNRNVSITVED